MESSRLGTGTELEHNRETGLVQAEDDFFVDKRPFISWVGSQAKFSLILLSYSAAFLTMVKLGFWMADTATTSSLEFHEIYNNTPVLVWLGEMMEGGDWLNSNVLKAAFDLCLLSLFVLQHTLLSSRILKETRIWYSLHHQYKMDKPLYTFTTALALMFLMWKWERIPVKVWNMEFLLENRAFDWIHIGAWASMYGTTIMLDLPEMIGLNQVVVQSPTLTVKSPEFQMMVQKQRHMGLLPFLAIFLIHPHMSLDRLLLSVFLSYYLCRQWTSDSAYEYAIDMKRVKKLRLSL